MVGGAFRIMGKVLILGLDGATWRLFAPWARAGRMPHLRALMERGSWGSLRSTVPPLTLPAWSSFMTGRNPGGHGVFAFRRMTAGRYETGGLASAADLRAPTLWELAGRGGCQVGAISVPPSYPIRPVNGFVVGCMLTPPGEPLAQPPEVAAEIGDYEVDLPAPRGLRRDAPNYLERAVPYLHGLVRQTEQRTQTTLRLMRRPWDLLCVVYYSPDRIQHYFWPYLDEGVAGEERDVRAALDRNYVALDDGIGRLVEAAGPETTVVLVSDHGFVAKPERAFHVNRWLADAGWLHERPFWRLRRWLQRRLVSRERRAQYDTADRMVDMSRTKAWAQTLEPGTTGLWVNVAGRYPLGCVAEGAEYESVRDALVGGLTRVRDEQGRAVFARVERREDMYKGPFVGEAPDVVAVCEERFGVIYESVRRDLRARTLFGPFEELGFNGTHHASGLYLFAGPEIAARGEHDEYPIESIAPTSLHLLGLPVPRAMEGPVCTSLFREEFLNQHPVRYTEEGGEEGAVVADGWKSAEDEARIAEHLRALGYVE